MNSTSTSTQAPSVEVVSATPDALVTTDDALDDLTIRVRYEDPTGDLGGGTARVHDCRSAAVVTELGIPTISNAVGVDEKIAISGELELVVTEPGARAVEQALGRIEHSVYG